jgi:hypothetical protein
MPRTTSLADALAKSPLLDTTDVDILFPTDADKAALHDLRNELATAIDDNKTAAEIWDKASQYRDTAIALLKKSFGI